MLKNANIKKVSFDKGYWAEKSRTNRDVTLSIEYEQLIKNGRVDFLKKDNTKFNDKADPYWDSDIAKWIEACAYNLALVRDNELEDKIDNIVDMFEEIQYENGYINSYFTKVEPGKEWTNLLYMHELYNAGHLIEGAVAYYEATGKRKFLDIMIRFADHICETFGNEKSKRKGCPGHPEIELALVKLYKITEDEKYLKQAKYFIDERGTNPNYFSLELKRRNKEINNMLDGVGLFGEFQAHKPIKEQTELVGHAVRALYLLSGTIDVAISTNDNDLLKTAILQWENTVNKKMYITGGVGSSPISEKFTFDYDLPNETAYAETCASIALVMATSRLLSNQVNSRYSDIIEKTLYNGIMSGVSISGDKFLYANILAIYPKTFKYNTNIINSCVFPERKEWFSTSCCPPNLARTLSSLGQYFYSIEEDDIYVHLYGQSTLSHNGLTLKQETDYPWNGEIKCLISADDISLRTIAFRIPGWCKKYTIKVNGENIKDKPQDGYVYIKKAWNKDEISINFEMSVDMMETHPFVRQNVGKIALQRGPIVYCLEEVDNGQELNSISISPDTIIKEKYDKKLKCIVLEFKGQRTQSSRFNDSLYLPYSNKKNNTQITAVPYSYWGNREVGEMLVWINRN